jgi:hypothetical protein
MRDEPDFSHSVSDGEKIKIFRKNISENRFNDTLIIDQLESNKNTSQLVNDQLIAVRLKRHNDYMTLFQKSKEQSNYDNNISNNNKNTKTRKSVLLCGDSMLNGIDSNGLSSKKHQVSVRNFPGATSNDMIDYTKPLINKKPDVMIIHVGTNDLTKNVVDTRSNLLTIVENIRNDSPMTEITLSNICLREDDISLNKKCVALNNEIESLASDYGLKVINNGNIDSSCLSKKKLHLNSRVGLPRFAKNVKNHINH